MANNKRNAKVELTLDKDRFDRGLDAAGRKLRKFARDGSKSLGDLDRSTASMVGGLGKKIGGQGMRAARVGLKGLGLAAAVGGIGVVSMAGDVLTLEKSLVRYQIASQSTEADIASLRGKMSEITRASGINRQELLDGAAAYVALTGDAAGAAAGMELFARVSNATGSSMADIAATAAAMKDNLHIDPKDFEAGFSALHVQGKAGAVELRELATELAGVAPQFSQFKGGGGTAGLVEMGSALQVVRKGFGSTSEAATGFRSLMVALQRNAKRFQAAGVRIYDKDPKTGKKTLRDFSDIIDAIGKSKLAKDPTLLTKAFGADEARRAYDQLALNRGLLDELISKSSDKAAIDRDSGTFLANGAVRAGVAWEKFKLKLAEVFNPDRIERFAAGLEGMVGAAERLVDNFEIAKQIMSGEDSNLVSPKVLATVDKYNARAAMIAGRDVPAFAMPDIGHFKTRNPGTTTDTPIVSEWEAFGREVVNKSRDYNLGSMLGFATSAMAERAQTSRMGSAPTLTPQGPMAGSAPTTMAAARPIVMTADVVVQVDGQAIARASANAASHRGTPGGR